MKKLLRSVKEISGKIFGTVIDEIYWRFRHIFIVDKWADNYISEVSLDHPHRKFLIEKISLYAPFNSILEIGCASGPNLYLLSKKFPEVRLYGTDISSHAIGVGRKWFSAQSIKNIQLASSKAEDLKRFPDKSIDIIFTDAILIYIGPDKIGNVIREMVRVARKAIILNERYDDSEPQSYKDHWIYDYKSLFKNFVGEERIKISKFTEDLWPMDNGWKEYGAVIEVEF